MTIGKIAMSFIRSQFLAAVLLLTSTLSMTFAQAESLTLLNTEISDCARNDFVSHFNFTKDKTVEGPKDTTLHVFISPSAGGVLSLGVEKTGRIVYMRLVMPREIIDNKQNTIYGRDLLKSFITASITNVADMAPLHSLSDELYFRGLDLQRITLTTKTFSDTGNPIPPYCYKLGPGPMKKGDSILPLTGPPPKLPALPSDLYLAAMGKTKEMGHIFTHCRIGFVNDTFPNGAKVLFCESWREDYWLSHDKPAKK